MTFGITRDADQAIAGWLKGTLEPDPQLKGKLFFASDALGISAPLFGARYSDLDISIWYWLHIDPLGQASFRCYGVTPDNTRFRSRFRNISRRRICSLFGSVAPPIAEKSVAEFRAYMRGKRADFASCVRALFKEGCDRGVFAPSVTLKSIGMVDADSLPPGRAEHFDLASNRGQDPGKLWKDCGPYALATAVGVAIGYGFAKWRTQGKRRPGGRYTPNRRGASSRIRQAAHR